MIKRGYEEKGSAFLKRLALILLWKSLRCHKFKKTIEILSVGELMCLTGEALLKKIETTLKVSHVITEFNSKLDL